MGWFWTALLNGGLAIAAYWTARFGLRQPAGWPRILAAVVLAWGWLTVGMEALGSTGLLARGPLLGWVWAGWLVGLGCKMAGRGVEEAEADRPAALPVSWEEVASFGLVVWASTMVGLASMLAPVKVVSDGPIYHLYLAIRWWKAGRLEWIATPFGENGATYFPAVGDLWFSWLVIGWGGDRLAKVGQGPFFGALGLTVLAIARRLGAGRRAAVVATAWVLLISPLCYFSFEANVDTIFVAGYLLSAYFFLRYTLGDDGPASLALGALAAGCALGTKAPAFVFVAPLLGLGVWSAAARGRTPAAKVLGALIVLLVPLTVAGFWYARNLIWTGNPLYPLHLAGLGRVWLTGWYGPDAMRLSEHYIPIGEWRALVDILLAVLDPRLVPIWLASLGGAWAWNRKSRAPVDRWVWAASGLAVANVLLYWVVIPYRTQQRFMFQALALAAIPLARTFDRDARLRAAGVVVLVLHVFTRQTWPFGDGDPPWDLFPTIPNDVDSLLPLPTIRLSDLFSTRGGGPYFLAGLVSFAIAWAAIRAAIRPTWRRVALAVASVLLFDSAIVVLSYPWGANPRRLFFPQFPDYFRGWMELDSRAGPSGARVAYAGTNLPYYLFGVNLRNDVRYVNVDAHPGWLMHDYHLEALEDGSGPATWPIPRPGWDRARPDYQAWLANLRREGIQLLVVTRVKPAGLPVELAGASLFPVERVWADAHPEAFGLLYGDPRRDPEFRLYRVKPPAGP